MNSKSYQQFQFLGNRTASDSLMLAFFTKIVTYGIVYAFLYSLHVKRYQPTLIGPQSSSRKYTWLAFSSLVYGASFGYLYKVIQETQFIVETSIQNFSNTHHSERTIHDGYDSCSQRTLTGHFPFGIKTNMGGIGFWSVLRRVKDIATARTDSAELMAESRKAAESVQNSEPGGCRGRNSDTTDRGSSVDVSINVNYRNKSWAVILLSISKKCLLSLMILIPSTILALIVSWNSHSYIPSVLFYFGAFFVLHRLFTHPLLKRCIW